MTIKFFKNLSLLIAFGLSGLISANEMVGEIGRGIQNFDSEAILRDRCIEMPKSDLLMNDYRETSYSLDLINNKEELFDKIVFNSKNSGSFGSFNAKTKMQFVKEVKWNFNSNYILVRAQRVTKTQSFISPNILLTQYAKKLLLDSRFKFLEACGNSFINKVNFGGEIFGLMEIKSSSYQEKQALEISLNASGSYGSAKGSSKSDYKREIERLSTLYKAKITFKHIGGEIISVPQNAEALLELSSRIEEITDRHPVAVSIETRDYSSVSNYVLDHDNYETKIRQDQIDWAEAKLKESRSLYAQGLYILENPRDFKRFDEVMLRNNLVYLEDKIMELKGFIAKAYSFLNDVNYTDITLDLNIQMPQQKRRAAKKELKTSCAIKSSPICGVSSYKKEKSSSCGIIGVNTGTGPSCGVVFNERPSEFCGVKDFKIAQAAVCGVATYRQCHHSSCGKNWDGSRKRCRSSACGAESYKSCRHESFGVEAFNNCRNEKHGIEKYLTCAHKDFGFDFETCEHLSHGPSSYKTCEVAKIGNQESFCPAF